jgi:hypothetical protein
MNEHSNHHFEDSEKDAVWHLLAEDAKAHPIEESSWFAARTTAKALDTAQYKTAQSRGLFSRVSFTLPDLRWLMPLPLAGVVAVTLLLIQHGPLSSHSQTFSSSESEFEQHMEMFASND